jgi:Putative prokaryotic signal transducing protein
MADRPKNDLVSAGERPAEKRDRPTPNKELVRVFDTEQESEAMVVNGLLQSAGIQSDLTSLDAPQDILPGVGGSVILVREEDAERARQLIQESKRAAAEEDTAEVDVTGDPTSLG